MDSVFDKLLETVKEAIAAYPQLAPIIRRIVEIWIGKQILSSSTAASSEVLDSVVEAKIQELVDLASGKKSSD